MISISRGDYSLDALPQLRGAGSALRFRGTDLLRPTAPGGTEPLQTAALGLVPFANRIAHGVFRLGGTDVRLEPNAAGQAHPLHGQGWRNPWRVESAQSGLLEMSFEHPAGEWPWAYAARQVLSLDEQGLEVRLWLENRDGRPMPAGLGWHPYLRRSPRLRLRTQVSGVWLTDEECLPTRHADETYFGDWSRGGRLLGDTAIDHCYSGWSGEAEVEWPEQMLCLRLSAGDPLRWLHLYAPPGRDFFCLEPVSHMPDALNRTEPAAVTGIKMLAPGEHMTGAIRLSVVPLAHSR